ncbi:MAG: AAA family ATPase, partial [Firmicutes bacterium]|nr:AAA family ATPase [Bacillota bacterium]
LRFHPDIRLVAQITDPQDSIKWAEEFCPDVVIFDEGWGSTALNCGSRIAKGNPNTVVVLGTNAVETETYRRAQAWGFNGLLPKPIQAEKIRELAYGRTDNIRRSGSADREFGAGIRPNVARQEVVVFYSPKGGVGKTTLSINFAAACLGNRGAGLRPVLLDFDLKADVAKMLQMKTFNTVSKWVDYLGKSVERQGLEAITAQHPCGLPIIPGIRSPLDAQDLSPDLVESLLTAVRRYYDVVVVDTGPEIHDASLIAFEMATRIFMVGTVDITTLRNIAETEDQLRVLMVDPGKVSLVMNRLPAKPHISMREIANVLPYPIVARIPEDPQVQMACNDARIAVTDFPDNPFSAAVKKLAGGTLPVLNEPFGPRSFWSFVWPFRRRKKEVA